MPDTAKEAGLGALQAADDGRCRATGAIEAAGAGGKRFEGRRMNRGHIGRSLHRLEDPRFLFYTAWNGQGRYVDDIDLPGQRHRMALRSS